MHPSPLAIDMISVDFKSATVYDMGRQLMISGPSERDVKEALDMLVNEDGAEIVSAPARVGEHWVAECTHPMADGCEVRHEGWKIIITGHSEEAVRSRAQQLTARGALMVEQTHFAGDRWAALLHEAGLRAQRRFG